MRAVGGNRKVKDWVLLTMYVFTNEIPRTLKYKSHSLDCVGLSPSRKHLTGVYGTNARDASLHLASVYAEQQSIQHMLLLDVWVHLPNFHATRSQITREIVQDTHWMHSDRLATTMKNEVQQKALVWVLQKFGPAAHAEASSLSVSALLLKYPEFAMKLLDDDKDLSMLVHPVNLKFDPYPDKSPIWVATVRLDRAQIVAAEVRHLPAIQVPV